MNEYLEMKFTFESYEDMKDNERILDIMDEIVSKMPEGYKYEPFIKAGAGHTDPRCWYIDSDGNVSCFIGRILEKMFWTKEEIAKLEGTTPNFGLGLTQPSAAKNLWQGLPRTSLLLFVQIQDAQDTGTRWSAIAERARSVFNERKLRRFGPE